MNKRGQMTMFVIIAIVIVVAGILIFQFVPQLKGIVTSVKEPEVYLQDCIEEDLMNNLDLIMSQGGVYVPSGSVKYKEREVEYLCYIEGYLEFCRIQRPFINKLVAEELKKSISNKTSSCFESLIKDYQMRGYEVNSTEGDFKIDIVPEKIIFRSNKSITLKKDTSLNYDGFEIEFNRNIYQLLEIVQTMVSFEAGLGDTPISLYMSAIPGLTVETETYSDGTEVYTLEDKYNNVFSFASRSRVFPAGYLPMEEEENIDYYENNEDVDRDTILDRKGGDETLH